MAIRVRGIPGFITIPIPWSQAKVAEADLQKKNTALDRRASNRAKTNVSHSSSPRMGSAHGLDWAYTPTLHARSIMQGWPAVVSYTSPTWIQYAKHSKLAWNRSHMQVSQTGQAWVLHEACVLDQPSRNTHPRPTGAGSIHPGPAKVGTMCTRHPGPAWVPCTMCIPYQSYTNAACKTDPAYTACGMWVYFKMHGKHHSRYGSTSLA